jgi:hypothetical protein
VQCDDGDNRDICENRDQPSATATATATTPDPPENGVDHHGIRLPGAIPIHDRHIDKNKPAVRRQLLADLVPAAP